MLDQIVLSFLELSSADTDLVVDLSLLRIVPHLKTAVAELLRASCTPAYDARIDRM